ncbi:MAG: hypothetical protein CL676_10495 [Bdellovibrionaceae bacterium]|nr:hypothetical protein [Pseudobdellovibrionaceae bacterium]
MRNLVTHIYTTILGRDPDAGGFEYYSGVLAQSRNVQTCQNTFRSFLTSSEFRGRNLNHTQYVEVLYKGVFNRTADSGGKNYYVGLLNSGAMSKDQLRETFINHQEAINYCSSSLR